MIDDLVALAGDRPEQPVCLAWQAPQGTSREIDRLGLARYGLADDWREAIIGTGAAIPIDVAVCDSISRIRP